MTGRPAPGSSVPFQTFRNRQSSLSPSSAEGVRRERSSPVRPCRARRVGNRPEGSLCGPWPVLRSVGDAGPGLRCARRAKPILPSGGRAVPDPLERRRTTTASSADTAVRGLDDRLRGHPAASTATRASPTPEELAMSTAQTKTASQKTPVTANATR